MDNDLTVLKYVIQVDIIDVELAVAGQCQVEYQEQLFKVGDQVAEQDQIAVVAVHLLDLAEHIL